MKTGIYIAGPMTGLPEFNFPAFHEAQRKLEAAGWFDIGNPAEMDEKNGLDATGLTGNEKPQDVGFDLAETLKMDLAWIADRAVAIALLPGWENSKGVAAELALARALGLEVRPVDDFIFREGDEVFIKEDARRYDGDPARLRGRKAIVRDLLDAELELWVEAPDEDDDEWDESYVRIEDVVRVKPEVTTADEAPIASVRALHEVLTADSGEVRVTSATGGQKGRKAAELGTVDPLALLVLAEVSGFGAQKYAAFNYLKGYDWSLSFNALTRHLLAFWNGEDLDPESGLPHITHAAWHALALTSFFKRGLGTDDRFKQEAA